jgi:hypothetical protein
MPNAPSHLILQRFSSIKLSGDMAKAGVRAAFEFESS